MWPSGQSTWAPCAVEHDALSGQGSNLSPGASVYQKSYFNSNNAYAHDVMNREIIPGKTEGSTVYSINCDRC